ncbi:unnamed protein product [Cyprideis torosa]|uniref:Uncharacterized protein n=1 Tax=Cyprideis torosa TaxID=163714 RepID=A0A7R8W7E8_9CRUS|nr:unnamed protein product [Cyprideis torosa]CAG0882090.1 unnamed protein product [Cyprideis torosa]
MATLPGSKNRVEAISRLSSLAEFLCVHCIACTFITSTTVIHDPTGTSGPQLHSNQRISQLNGLNSLECSLYDVCHSSVMRSSSPPPNCRVDVEELDENGRPIQVYFLVKKQTNEGSNPTTDVETPPYDVSERLKEVNDALYADPTPVEDDRPRKVKFKEQLCVVFSEPESEADEDDSHYHVLESVRCQLKNFSFKSVEEDPENEGRRAEVEGSLVMDDLEDLPKDSDAADDAESTAESKSGSSVSVSTLLEVEKVPQVESPSTEEAPPAVQEPSSTDKSSLNVPSDHAIRVIPPTPTPTQTSGNSTDRSDNSVTSAQQPTPEPEVESPASSCSDDSLGIQSLGSGGSGSSISMEMAADAVIPSLSNRSENSASSDSKTDSSKPHKRQRPTSAKNKPKPDSNVSSTTATTIHQTSKTSSSSSKDKDPPQTKQVVSKRPASLNRASVHPGTATLGVPQLSKSSSLTVLNQSRPHSSPQVIPTRQSRARSKSPNVNREYKPRPRTVPGGTQGQGNIKLPKYEGLNSPYGLTAEQIEMKRKQREEKALTRRREREERERQEQEREREKEAMFQAWLKDVQHRSGQHKRTGANGGVGTPPIIMDGATKGKNTKLNKLKDQKDKEDCFQAWLNRKREEEKQRRRKEEKLHELMTRHRRTRDDNERAFQEREYIKEFQSSSSHNQSRRRRSSDSSSGSSSPYSPSRDDLKKRVSRLGVNISKTKIATSVKTPATSAVTSMSEIQQISVTSRMNLEANTFESVPFKSSRSQGPDIPLPAEEPQTSARKEAEQTPELIDETGLIHPSLTTKQKARDDKYLKWIRGLQTHLSQAASA